MSEDEEHHIQGGGWPEYFSFAERSLAYCNKYKPQFLISSEDPQKVHAAAFFAKLLKDAEAALLLLKEGMFSQARSMLRVAVECEITLAKCWASPEFVEAYRIASEKERLRLQKGIQKITLGDFDEVKDAITLEMVDSLSVQLKGASSKNLEQWAIEVNMGDLYQTGYRLYSADVHSLVRSVGRFLKYNSSGLVSEVNWNPEEPDCRSELTEVCRIALNGLGIAGTLFGLSHDETFDQYLAELYRLEELVANEG